MLARRIIPCLDVANGRVVKGTNFVQLRDAGELLLTSMDRDGTGQGYDVELVRAVATTVTVPVIASGGVGELAHLAGGLEAGADAVLAASIFHFGRHTISEAKAFLAARGIAVRS